MRVPLERPRGLLASRRLRLRREAFAEWVLCVGVCVCGCGKYAWFGWRDTHSVEEGKRSVVWMWVVLWRTFRFASPGSLPWPTTPPRPAHPTARPGPYTQTQAHIRLGNHGPAAGRRDRLPPRDLRILKMRLLLLRHSFFGGRWWFACGPPWPFLFSYWVSIGKGSKVKARKQQQRRRSRQNSRCDPFQASLLLLTLLCVVSGA